MALFKKTLLFLMSLLSFLVAVLLIGATVIFFRPGIVLNPETIDYALTKTQILKDWSWKHFEINHSYMKWNRRRISGELVGPVIEYESEEIELHFDGAKFSWDFVLSWTPTGGFKFESTRPLLARINIADLKLKEGSEAPGNEESAPFDLWSYWQILWEGGIPDFDLEAQKIALTPAGGKAINFELSAKKNESSLKVKSFGLSLSATPEGLTLLGPADYPLPTDLNLSRPLKLISSELKVKVSKDHLPLALEANVNGLILRAQSELSLPLAMPVLEVPFLKDALLDLQASLKIEGVRSQLKESFGPPFDLLPAPFNVLEGGVSLKASVQELEKSDQVRILLPLSFDLSGGGQVVDLDLRATLDLNLRDLSLAQIDLELLVERLALLLPRLSVTSLPPQLVPDSRFTSARELRAQKRARKEESALGRSLNFDLKASGKQTIQVRSNLLDEPLRLNFDLALRAGEIASGEVKILELNTSVFKRPITLKEALIEFRPPLEPSLKSTILFKLPEYTVTLELEGPASEPRSYFSSSPPLPQEDIISVLLFGSPMSELDSDDQAAAGKTSRLISRGILSLSVLYFFAGSPVQSIGYNPESNEVSAQIGLGERNSLRLASEGEGLSSVGVRRSLGKGWYLDTSVQRAQSATPTESESGEDYGVLLERIISY